MHYVLCIVPWGAEAVFDRLLVVFSCSQFLSVFFFSPENKNQDLCIELVFFEHCEWTLRGQTHLRMCCVYNVLWFHSTCDNKCQQVCVSVSTPPCMHLWVGLKKDQSKNSLNWVRCSSHFCLHKNRKKTLSDDIWCVNIYRDTMYCDKNVQYVLWS